MLCVCRGSNSACTAGIPPSWPTTLNFNNLMIKPIIPQLHYVCTTLFPLYPLVTINKTSHRTHPAVAFKTLNIVCVSRYDIYMHGRRYYVCRASLYIGMRLTGTVYIRIRRRPIYACVAHICMRAGTIYACIAQVYMYMRRASLYIGMRRAGTIYAESLRGALYNQVLTNFKQTSLPGTIEGSVNLCTTTRLSTTTVSQFDAFSLLR